MNSTAAAKRPWFAAALALLVTGLGHAYLRRWARAFGWLCLATLTTVAFVPPEAIQDPELASIREVAPLLVVVGLSGLDAYLLARSHNTRRRVEAGERCPACYHELEGDLAFCPWCATELPASTEGDDWAATGATERSNEGW